MIWSADCLIYSLQYLLGNGANKYKLDFVLKTLPEMKFWSWVNSIPWTSAWPFVVASWHWVCGGAVGPHWCLNCRHHFYQLQWRSASAMWWQTGSGKLAEDSSHLEFFLCLMMSQCRSLLIMQLNVLQHLSGLNLKVKDIGLECAASWPDCPHHWYQQSGIWDLWSRFAPLLRYHTPGLGIPCVLHSTDWSNSLGWSYPLHNVGRSQTVSPHRSLGLSRWRLPDRKKNVCFSTAFNKCLCMSKLNLPCLL